MTEKTPTDTSPKSPGNRPHHRRGEAASDSAEPEDKKKIASPSSPQKTATKSAQKEDVQEQNTQKREAPKKEMQKSDSKKKAPEQNTSTDPKAGSKNDTRAASTKNSSDSKVPASQTAEQKPSEQKPSKQKPAKPKAEKPWLGALLVILCVLVLASGGAWYWLYQKLDDIEVNMAASGSSFANKVELSTMSDELNRELSQARQSFNNKSERVRNRLEALEQRSDSLLKRVRALSTTSREDWLLAEAEYLLKLANQRVLIERSGDSAIGLLEEADAILHSLADPDVFPLRSAIKEDLIALKLVESIDREGLYLELAALSKKTDAIPLVPESYQYQTSENAEPTNSDITDADSDPNESVLSRFFASFSSYVRVIDHSDKPEAILPPEQSAYLHLNLRFMLERAQVALLREQQKIYTESLQEAGAWIKKYYPRSKSSATYAQRLNELSEQKITVVLPDISTSLHLLHDYIELLHTLGESAENKSNSAPLEKAPTSKNTNIDTSKSEAL